MSTEVKHRIFELTGNVHEPQLNELVWDWAQRTTDDTSNLRSVPVMKTLWSHVDLSMHHADMIVDYYSKNGSLPLEQLYENGDILSWGYSVFFTDDVALTLFKLTFSQYISSCTIVERITKTCGN